MNLPKPLKKATIRHILSGPAFELMYARDRAKAFLKENGCTDDEITDIIETALGEIAKSYKVTIEQMGREPKSNIAVSIIPMPIK